MLINVDKYVKLGKIAADFRRYQEVGSFSRSSFFKCMSTVE